MVIALFLFVVFKLTPDEETTECYKFDVSVCDVMASHHSSRRDEPI